MKRPIVTTNIRGCREAIEDGRTGILVPVKYVKEIAKAIIYLLDNPLVAKEMGENGRMKVTQEFDEEFIFKKLESEYQRLIEYKLK
jgi:glycosyltransferase involved in cell wall biosynthesis